MNKPIAGGAAALLFAALCSAEPPVQDTVIDPTFGTSGHVVVPFDVGGPMHDIPEKARPDGRGGYWIVGRANIALQRSILAVLHLDRAGNVLGKQTRPDYEFNRENPSAGIAYEVQDATVDTEGRLLLSVVRCSGPSQEQCGSFLLRFNGDATPDVRWGGTGTVAAASAVYYGGIHAADDGRVWVSEDTRLNILSSAGSPVGFATAPRGSVTFARMNATSVIGLSAASSGNAAVLTRFDASGAPDLSYAGDGARELAVGATPQQCGAPAGSDFDVRELSVLADGRIAVLGFTRNISGVVLQSYLVGVGANGAIGPVTCLAPPAEGSPANNSALRADGRVFLTVGSAPTGSPVTGRGMAIAAMRLQSDGSIVADPTFNGGQPFAIEIPRTDGGSPDSVSTHVLVDQGAVVVIGAGRVSNTRYDFTVARVLGDLRLFHSGFED